MTLAEIRARHAAIGDAYWKMGNYDNARHAHDDRADLIALVEMMKGALRHIQDDADDDMPNVSYDNPARFAKIFNAARAALKEVEG